jgi:hypothetical protein
MFTDDIEREKNKTESSTERENKDLYKQVLYPLQPLLLPPVLTPPLLLLLPLPPL